jgi:hypothetical protein
MPFSKLTRIVFYVECIFAQLFVLTVVPFSGHTLVIPKPTLLGFIDFGGYCWLALGLLLYLYGSIRALMGKTKILWSSFAPPIVGLPIFVWGFGKCLGLANVVLVVSAALVATILSAGIVRTPMLHWRVLPAVLLVTFFVTADIAYAGWSNLFIGTVLLTAPLFLWFRNRTPGGVTAPRTEP